MPNKVKILIVEDEHAIALALKLKLEHEGFEVTVANDGVEGVEAVKNSASPFNAIVLDLVMPRLDGFGVLEELKKMGNKVPVLVSSNLSQEEDARRAKALGAKDYFIKSNTALSDVIEHIKKAAQ